MGWERSFTFCLRCCGWLLSTKLHLLHRVDCPRSIASVPLARVFPPHLAPGATQWTPSSYSQGLHSILKCAAPNQLPMLTCLCRLAPCCTRSPCPRGHTMDTILLFTGAPFLFEICCTQPAAHAHLPRSSGPSLSSLTLFQGPHHGHYPVDHRGCRLHQACSLVQAAGALRWCQAECTTAVKQLLDSFLATSWHLADSFLAASCHFSAASLQLPGSFLAACQQLTGRCTPACLRRTSHCSFSLVTFFDRPVSIRLAAAFLPV